VIPSGTEVKPEDELVRLDTLVIENTISERTKYAHWSRSSAERSRATVATAELAILEYLEGRYRRDLMELEKNLAIAESNLRTAKSMLGHAKMMAERGYVSELQVEERTFEVTQAELNVEVTNTQIDVLKEFTKKMELETLQGNLKAAKARLAADEERAKMDAARRDLALEELEYCVVKAERSGMVIHPSAARWENAPEIEQGTTVHKDQVLLLMPDLSKMQVKLGIRESSIDRVKPGLAVRVTLPDRTLDGEVSTVASVTAPAGWWTANEVRYDTTIDLPSVEGLKPGMSAEVEVIVARHEDVLTIPVAAVAETAAGNFCWVKTSEGAQRRRIELGDTNDVFTVVKSGLKEGDEVMLNPRAFMENTQTDAVKPLDEIESGEPNSKETGSAPKPQEPKATKPPGKSKQQDPKQQASKPKQADSQSKTPGNKMTKPK
jgi:multidrug efflux pump subunit AcrA (membrane-fusion protein)